ncbi:MAG: hypothetical protein M3P83_02500, partial [Actinomycetota bacterium]|nr:hypothetical protein [Actinomycetota bacterium]
MTEHHSPEPVVVRRRGAVFAVLGIGAAALAGTYMWRAADQGGLGPWLVGLALAVLAVANLVQWADARTPLLVADETGVRVRFGAEWHGLLWADVAEIAVRARRGVRAGHIAVQARADAVVHPAGDEYRARRARAAIQRRYGAALAVPLGPTTAVSADSPDEA